MKLKVKEKNNGEDDLGLDLAGPLSIVEKIDKDDWALSFLKSLEKAPREVVDMLNGDLLKAVLKEVAKTEGDAGVVARLAISLLERCK